MSDELKLDLAREIYPDSKRARKESFSATQWAGVERAWAWVTLNFQPSNPDTYLNEFLREKLRTEISVHDAIHESVQQPKELTVKQEPAPSPAPAGVPVDRECCVMCFHKSGAKSWERTMIVCPDCGNKRCPKATNHVNACTGSNEPGQSGSLYVDDGSFNVEPALRTRDERIAELERERDELLAKMGTHVEHHIRGADTMQDHMEKRRATIATLTKERDEAREKLVAVHDRCIKRGEERDAALARVAELTKERDTIKSIAAQAQDRVAELEKRGAVDVEACVDYLNAHGNDDCGCGNGGTVKHCIKSLNDIFRKHSRDVRRITREEIDRATHTWYDDRRVNESPLQWMERALRAIGFEVEA